MRKWMKAVISISVIAVVLGSALLIYFFGHKFPEFDKMSTVEFAIPGLNEKYAPQGLCYMNEDDKYLVSGYMSNGEASRIYVVDGQTQKTEKYVSVSGLNNDLKNAHFGGVAAQGNFVYIASDGYLITIEKSALLAAQDKASIEFVECFNTYTGADFCFANDDGLWVGEFYRKGNYETDTSHHLKISDKEINHAIALHYNLDAGSTCGIELIPDKAVSILDLVQGFAITNSNKIVLSTSYGLPDSKILIYKNVLADATDKTITVNEIEMPLYVLSFDKLEETIVAPCMSEGIDYVDGSVKILFESASKKYKMFTRNRISDVLSIEVA